MKSTCAGDGRDLCCLGFIAVALQHLRVVCIVANIHIRCPAFKAALLMMEYSLAQILAWLSCTIEVTVL